MTKKTDSSWGGKAATIAGAAIGSAAIAAAVLYARRVVRREVPPMEGVWPASTDTPESD